MIQDQGKQKAVCAGQKARSARLRRMEIQIAKSNARKESECGGSLASPRWRNIAFRKVASIGGTDQAMKDAKLKGAVEDMSSGISLLSPKPFRCPDHCSSDLGQIEEKGQTENEESSEKLVGTLKYGSVSLIGRRRAMEDAVTVAPGAAAGKYSFFAAYDGHGGDRVANSCRERLHKLLENELQEAAGVEPTTSTGKVDWEKVMAACFSRMDDEVTAEDAMGSTAVVVIVGKEEVVVANCGDSRAVLCRGGVAIPLSDDHKPERPDERERVEAAGGNIIDWNGCRVQGVLSTSRSIGTSSTVTDVVKGTLFGKSDFNFPHDLPLLVVCGDRYLKPYVISEPEVTLTRRIESDEFLIIATDGLWDVVSNEFACEVVRRCLAGRIRRKSSAELGAEEAAAILAELAVAKGSRDNISVIVVQLKTKF